MQRRKFLAAVGLGVASSVAGCASDGADSAAGSAGTESGTPAMNAPFEHAGTVEARMVANGDYPADDNPANGYPPEFSDPPKSPEADPSSFETITTNEETIRLVPIDVAEAWYRRGEARFVDARGLYQYKHSHIYGSVLSPAQKQSDGGAIPDWGRDERVVTYCGCPHHLSSLRAAGLQKAGYSEVYAIDEGFGVWSDRSYPMAGSAFATDSESSISEWTIEGAVDSQFAGEYAWASADRQYEAVPIDADGGFTLHLKFADVNQETPVQVSTPAFTTTRPLGELATGVLDG